jgi:hypothetical protein
MVLIRYWQFGQEQQCVWMELGGGKDTPTSLRAKTLCGHLQLTRQFVENVLSRRHTSEYVVVGDVVERDAAQASRFCEPSHLDILNAELAKRGFHPAVVSGRVPDMTELKKFAKVSRQRRWTQPLP